MRERRHAMWMTRRDALRWVGASAAAAPLGSLLGCEGVTMAGTDAGTAIDPDAFSSLEDAGLAADAASATRTRRARAAGPRVARRR